MTRGVPVLIVAPNSRRKIASVKFDEKTMFIWEFPTQWLNFLTGKLSHWVISAQLV
jgi:hypothetical protein